ncbi:MAG: 1-(5-phosphoribosyl)-5-[(5-phosphoribosylamino)methylideneamino]imidazole-4-carboxamide isomerase [Dehalococcoidia bacterium]|nr:1-(5-phosphoribosyl)-5-[(5-phosphoribosylamino)methylideneamino]imidazole-4-carboxamide isomerase [Dehalococcoidia bacterium]
MTFEVIPAIDLRGGRCVQLVQGDYSRETQYSNDPVAMAQQWQDLGAPRLHVVDLDGAKQGYPFNRDDIAAICRAVELPVEVSGGIRNLEAVRDAMHYGAQRVQLGSAAVRDPDLVRAACSEFPGRIVVAIDARNGEVMTDGWLKGSGIQLADLVRQMVDLGVPRIMFTDISRDGVLAGPNFDTTAELVRTAGVPIVASGGVSSVGHIRKLASIGCEGAIVGTALYEGTLDLREALTAATQPASS